MSLPVQFNCMPNGLVCVTIGKLLPFINWKHLRLPFGEEVPYLTFICIEEYFVVRSPDTVSLAQGTLHWIYARSDRCLLARVIPGDRAEL